MVSLKDIAKECNVTVATVSKALNDKNDIGEQMKEYIKETAKKMGYYPNSAARALKTKKSYNIGILFVDGTNSGITHEFFSQILEQFKDSVEQKGYDIAFVNRYIGENSMSYLEHCRYRAFDGVLIACIDFNQPQVLELVESDIPTVTIDHLYPGHVSVMSDNAHGMEDLLSYITEKGHEKIAYIYGQDCTVTYNRLDSFKHFMESRNLPIKEEYLIQGKYNDVEKAAMLTKQLMELPEPPTCIVYCDDMACIGGMSELNKMGLSIPEDVAVAGYDGVKVSQMIYPKLTTVKQDVEGMGKEAARKMIELIEDKSKRKEEIIRLKSHLISGESV